ncbi:Lysophospholipid acyltransferase [Neolecta irregularis DAH-3]|uniref:Lysophospholipid acyltransferase n=1 Tax=Neolecta irregularis (strain DAH-3) TaxID=1198029 RepID=A0A1U7LWZ6_NEOID|nr:Lysophospholipid acyltransferase [Neolecta irregularis DAH-3]|eukprot:OLL27148.1 Lysophospholipid acyltransferase [Neolecta irregularis DAH-3]
MIPFVEAACGLVAPTLGISSSQTKIPLCLVLSLPFAAVLKRLPDHRPDIKNIYSISVSLFYLLGIFSLWCGLRTLLISSLGTYVLSAFIKNKYMPLIVFVFVLGHMGFNHFRSFGKPDETVDIIGAQMVLCMKMTSFAWNIHDGRQPEATLSAFQKDRALRYLPSLLDFLGYVFFFPSLLIGPTFDMAEYLRFINLTMFDVDVPDKTSKTGRGRQRKIPSSSGPALKMFLEGIMWDFPLSNEYLSYSFLQRLFYLMALSFTYRAKYFGAWTLSESGVILSGFGYNGVDSRGKRRWDRVTNIEPWTMETAQSSKVVLEAWNKNTNKWLKNYVYMRVASNKKGVPGTKSSLFTFATLAFWHGFQAGYYLTFGTAAFVQICDYRRHLRPFFLNADCTPTNRKIYYDVLGWFVTKIAYDYLVMPVAMLDFKSSIICWYRLWFFGHVGIALTLAFFMGPGKQWIDRKLKKRGQLLVEAEATDEIVASSIVEASGSLTNPL